MNRRDFLGAASTVVAAQSMGIGKAAAAEPQGRVKPFDLGLLIVPYSAPEEKIKLLRQLGLSNCYLSLDGYINTGGDFTPEIVALYRRLLKKYEITVTTVEVVGPPPLEWNFLRGPSTIGVIPPATRKARIDALRKASNFA